MPYGEGVLGRCFRGTFMLIVQLYVMLLKNQAYPRTRAEQPSLATPVRALSDALASRHLGHPSLYVSTTPALYSCTVSGNYGILIKSTTYSIQSKGA